MGATIRAKYDLIRRRLGDLAQLMAERKTSLFFLFFLLTGCLLAQGAAAHRLAAAVVVGSAVLLVLLLAWKRKFWYAVLLPLLGGMLLASTISLALFDGYVGRYQKMAEAGETASVCGVVTDVVWTNSWSGQYVLRVTGEGLPYSVVVTSSLPSLTTGRVLSGEIRYVPWEEAEASFDEEQYYLSRGVAAAAEDVSLADTGETKQTLTGLFRQWNRTLSDKISAHVQNDGLPLAMLLGNREVLSDTVKRDFRRMGILHLLAVSGTHFTMLASMTENLFIRLRIRPGRRYGLLFCLAILYMLLTGLTASVLRAGLMFLVSLLCRALEMKVRYFASLNISCGLICLLDPFAVLDVGLHLSYLAVCGCLLTIRLERNWDGWQALWKRKNRNTDGDGKPVPLSRRQKLLQAAAKGALSMGILNLVITGLTLPLTWLYFGELSTLSLFVNLVYIPATGLLLFLTLLYLVLYPLVFPVLPMASLLSAYAALLEVPAGWLSALPGASFSLAYPFIPLFLVPLFALVCFLPFLRRKLAGLTAVAVLLGAMTGAVLLYDRVTADRTLLVYRNDRIKEGFVVRSGGEVLLLDISDGSYGFTGKLLTEAKALYATELAGYMITHYHNRHVGTFQSLTDDWILRSLYLPEPATEEEEAVFRSLCEEAAEKGIPVTVFDGETDFHHMHIVLPERTWLTRSTHPVTGVILEAEGITLAYGSSSFAEGAETIAEALAEADIGILGAHSPVTKKEYALPFREPPQVLIWNGEAAAYYTGTRPAARQELENCTRFAYRFPDA